MPLDNNLAIVIVTYKRQELLELLFKSFEELTKYPKFIVIVDNENSPKTKELAVKLEEALENTNVSYVSMEENTGGSGGFSKGVEVAYELGAEWIWVMDDDVKVFPESLEKLAPWLTFGEENNHLAIQVQRKNYDGTNFYWQYDFKNHLGIPNPVAPAGFAADEKYRLINTACFEGGLFHRSLVKNLGLPDNRFFIYWDDTIYGYLASKETQPILINETLMARTRSLDNIKIGKIRKLNSTSDMTRYYIMRNRGYMAQYLRLHGDYNPLIYGFGTFLTFAKETIRLAMADHFWRGLKILFKGMSDGKQLRRDKTWKPMPQIK